MQPTSSVCAPLYRKWLLLPSVSVTAAILPSQGRPSFEGDPLIADTSLALAITQRCSLPQIGPPRFNWRRNPPPRQIEFGPFPGCKAGTPDTQERIVNMSSSCWPAITRPHRGATEIDHHRDLMPTRQPGKQALAWPMSSVMSRVAHISSGPSPGKMSDVTD